MPPDLRSLSHKWFTEVWNNRSAAAIDRFAADDVLVPGLTDDGHTARGSCA
jgi:hypothetical protein